MQLATRRLADTSTAPVVGVDGHWHDLRPLTEGIDADVLSAAGRARIRDALAAGALPRIAAPAEFAPPVASIGKIVCVGLNYVDHAAETGATPPAEPILFLKAADTVVGAYDEVLIPRGSTKTDYEVELAVVIGEPARYLPSAAAAADCIAGYAISNDVSERAFQLERGGQWDKGKNCATFNPFGPWVTTADEIEDPQALALRLWVNGELRQDGHTKNMIFDVHELVHYVSQFMTLYPGDVVNTGTPAGVGMGRPDGYLRPGDVVELEIDGLGRQRQVIGSA
jgi:2-keto-4-pentenoate hydratase/2-oxohepta-3-ene-1,7-dioic acid hydratase in catechol pathway